MEAVLKDGAELNENEYELLQCELGQCRQYE